MLSFSGSKKGLHYSWVLRFSEVICLFELHKVINESLFSA